MNQYITAEIIRVVVATASLIFAIWQYLQNRRIKKLIALEAVELHKNIAVALGATDAAIKSLNGGNDGRAEVGRAQGLCQAVLYESAKLYCNLKNTKLDDIDDLIANNQLAENYRHIYYSFSDERRGKLGKFKKWFSKQF